MFCMYNLPGTIQFHMFIIYSTKKQIYVMKTGYYSRSGTSLLCGQARIVSSPNIICICHLTSMGLCSSMNFYQNGLKNNAGISYSRLSCC